MDDVAREGSEAPRGSRAQSELNVRTNAEGAPGPAHRAAMREGEARAADARPRAEGSNGGADSHR